MKKRGHMLMKKRHEEEGTHVLTMFPLVASPSSPPKAMTGDMQAQYRKRTEATHCRLTASRTSLHRNGIFRRTSFTKPPKTLQTRRVRLS